MIPGIDWALIGYQDLSQSYGIPGQWQNKLILDAGAKVRALCKQRGIAYAAVPPSVEDFEPMIKDGAQMLLYGSDVSFLYGGAKRGVEALKALIEK